MNARLGWLSLKKAHPAGPFGCDGYRSEKLNGCWLCAQAIDCSTLVQASDILVAGELPGVCSFRVSDAPKSTTSIIGTNDGAFYEAVSRTGADPPIHTRVGVHWAVCDSLGA